MVLLVLFAVLCRDFVVFLVLIYSGGVSASCGLLCIVHCPCCV